MIMQNRVYVAPDGTLTTEGYFALNGIEQDAAGPVAWGDVTGKPSTFPPSAHNQAWSTITSTPTTVSGYGMTSDLAATVQAYALNVFADPVAAVEFAQQQALQFVVENRTSDPGSPVPGQLWLRTDL